MKLWFCILLPKKKLTLEQRRLWETKLNGSTYQEDLVLLNLYKPNNTGAKWMNWKMTELKGETDKFTLTDSKSFLKNWKKHINGKSARISESLSTNRIKEVFIEHSIQQTEHKIFSSMQRTYEK